MGLPSCGVVFRDEWRRGPGETVGCPAREMAIVVWEGLKAPFESLDT